MRVSGSVKNWNEHRSYGWLKPDDGGEDVFCHVVDSPTGERLARGTRLEFAREDRGRGPRATAVVILNGRQTV